MALLRQRRAVSSDRSMSVSGPRGDANALLLEALQQTRTAIENLLGMPMPRAGQSVRIQVLPHAEGPREPGEISLRIELAGSDLIHRVTLPDYESAYLETAREAVVYALLSVYVLDITGERAMPVLPAWFWQGVMQVLYPDDIDITLANLDLLWRTGEMPSLADFLRHPQGARLEPPEVIFAGGMVYWLASRPSHESILPAILVKIGARDLIDVDWLRAKLGASPDELLDRWILAQRRTVRGIGAVMTIHLENLRAVLLLYPGQHGIPQNASVGWGAPLHTLVAHRGQPWFGHAVRKRRRVLQAAAQGRPPRFREVVDEFVALLDAAIAGEEQTVLEEQESLAYVALALLAMDVDAGGGIWRQQE